MSHIRHQMPRKGGNNFYRDKTDYARFVKTLCGADVTDRDVDFRTAGTKKFQASDWPVCEACRRVRQAAAV